MQLSLANIEKLNQLHPGGYKMAHMQISLLNNVSFIPLLYLLASGTELLLSFSAYCSAVLLFNNGCLLVGSEPDTFAHLWEYGGIHVLCDI